MMYVEGVVTVCALGAILSNIIQMTTLQTLTSEINHQGMLHPNRYSTSIVRYSLLTLNNVVDIMYRKATVGLRAVGNP